MDEKQKKELEKKALEGAAVEVVERYGSAVKEHLVAFSGQDNELGKEATRSLKSIAESKVNDSFKDQNIKQQAGFSAEVKSVAKDNADKIIRGSEKRTSRTDDVAKQVDSTGRSIGGTNDQLFDLVEMNGDGTIVEGTARQLKFVGGDAKSCAEKLLDTSSILTAISPILMKQFLDQLPFTVTKVQQHKCMRAIITEHLC